MKRIKTIALTSILTFSLNIFTPNVFSQEKLVDQNAINQNNNSIDSKNKDEQEISENNSNNTVSNSKIEGSNSNLDINEVVKPSDTNTHTPLNHNNAISDSIIEESSSSLDVNEVADIPDKNLKAILNEAISPSRNPEQDIYVSELKKIKFLRSNRLITNIKGLEYCTKITTLDFSYNKISNIEPLKNLTNLNYLDLGNNKISNIEPLKNLTNLTTLRLGNNQISDIKPLKNLTKLNHLFLYHNQISDIDPLKNLTKLFDLNLAENPISNIEPLRNLTNLIYLTLTKTQISDIEPLRNLINLDSLSLDKTQINDIEPLRNLTNLSYLNLSYNQISNIEPLKNLIKLININLEYNKIIDLSPLSEFDLNILKHLSMLHQNIKLTNTVVDDGNLEINNAVTFWENDSEIKHSPVRTSSYDVSHISITYPENGKKIRLQNIKSNDNNLNITESFSIYLGSFSIPYSLNIYLTFEHASMIKVELPTSMTFNVVTNTVNPLTNYLEPTFITSDYTIKNKGNRPVTITPSYSVTDQGGVDLIENLSDNDILKDNNVKLSVKLKLLSTNKYIMSVVNNSTGTSFNLEPYSSTKLRFEPGENGMADIEKEQLRDTQITKGKITFTISN
ncbi:leucine-rich repeat domain-containing protein [Clostridium perfringens]|uniref:leucine-rich repeat domain-containing protein n=1 Tax=Clostridium perfringens TaxID=1502 RepID=UPI003BAD6CFA|nr:leucine-rich repeat domain-containing protein [Clostridium perfringens]